MPRHLWPRSSRPPVGIIVKRTSDCLKHSSRLGRFPKTMTGRILIREDWVTAPRVSAARSAGLLLHPTSLAGPFGIGDLGPAAYAWVDALLRARQKWWQILPLGPTGYGDSPYQCFSAFAGNIYLLSPDFLLRDG